MNRKQPNALQLGPDVVKLLLPHRQPLLMVDRIESYTRTPRATLQASRYISVNEPVFAGHFPNLSLWPGVYTIEGLGQSCNLLLVLAGLQEAWAARGASADEPLELLRNLELGYRLQPGFRPELAGVLEEVFRNPADRMGFAAAVDVKFLQPVFAGQRLDYRVTQTHVVDNMVRFDVEAQVEGRPVARGTMTSYVKVVLPELGRRDP